MLHAATLPPPSPSLPPSVSLPRALHFRYYAQRGTLIALNSTLLFSSSPFCPSVFYFVVSYTSLLVMKYRTWAQ